jgi:hypothetical protein
MAIDSANVERQMTDIAFQEFYYKTGAAEKVTRADLERFSNLTTSTNLKNEVRLQELINRKLGTFEMTNETNAEALSGIMASAYKDISSKLTTGNVVKKIFGKSDQNKATALLEY